jgi:hypothetical protein
MPGFFQNAGIKPSNDLGGVKDLYVPYVNTPLDSITGYVRTLSSNILGTTQTVNDTAKLSEVAFGMAALGATVFAGYTIYKVIKNEVK